MKKHFLKDCFVINKNKNCKIITGSISTKDIRIPYSCHVNKCPLTFSTLKIDMPVLQINEKHNTNIEIINTA